MRKAVTGETHRLDWMAPGPLTTAPSANFKEEGQTSIIYLEENTCISPRRASTRGRK